MSELVELGIPQRPDDRLRERLHSDKLDAESAIEDAITVYLHAKDWAAVFDGIAKEAREQLAEIMAETGKTTLEGASGKATVTAPSVSVSYDRKALDALCASSDAARKMLEPHRKESERAGTMRITKS